MSSYTEAGSDIQMQTEKCLTPEPPVPLRRSPLEGIDPNVPDQRLTASVSKVMKRAAYSPITPFTTPTGKVSAGVTRLELSRGPGELTTTNVGVREPRDTTGNGSSIEDMFCSEGFHTTTQDLDSDSPDNVPLNTLVFKRAFQMVEDFKQSYKMEHEGKVQHLQGYITDLELSLKALGRECQNSRPTSPAPPQDSSTNLAPESSTILPPESSIYPPPVKMVSRGTVTRFFPKLSGLNTGSVSSPTEEFFSFRSDMSGLSAMSGDVTNSTTDTFTTSVIETQTVRVDMCERCSEDVNPQTNIAASQTNPVVTCTTEVQTEMVETNTDTTQVHTEKVGNSSHSTDTQTEIINTAITASQTIPLITCTTEAQTEMVETNTDTTQVQTEKEISSHTTYTQTEEVENIHTATVVSQTDPLITRTTEVQTEDVELATCTTEVQTDDVELAMCTTEAQTEGVTTRDALTMVTPLKHLSQDICVGTSPFVVSLPRPSEVGSSEFSVQQLCCHLESASVSNGLLRSEVECLQSQSASQGHLVSRLQGELTQAEAKVKAESQTQVSELLSQQASLLTQVSELTEKVERLGSDKQRLVLQVANVEKDLCLAYKQHKIQIDSLNQELRDNDYKALYHRLYQENAELHAQLEELVQMGEAVRAFGEQQMEIQRQWLEKSLVICELAKENKEKEKALEKERSDWLREQEERERALDSRLSDYTEVREERDRLSTQVCHQRELLGTLRHDLAALCDVRGENCTLQDQLEALQRSAEDNQEFMEQERMTLSEELQEEHRELIKLRSDKETLIRRLKEARVMYQDLECECEGTREHAHAMLLTQGQEMSDTITAVEGLSQSLDVMYSQLDRQVSVWSQQVSVVTETEDPSETPIAMTPCHGNSTPQSTIASIVSAFKDMPVSTSPPMSNVAKSLFEGSEESESESEKTPVRVSAFIPVQPRSKESIPETPLTNRAPANEQAEDHPETPPTDDMAANEEAEDIPVSERVEAANQKLRDIMGLMISLKSHVTTVMSALQQDMQQRESEWTGERRTLTSRASDLQGEVSGLSGQLEDSQQRLDRLQETLRKNTAEKQQLEADVCELREVLEARNTALLEREEQESSIRILQDENEKHRQLLQQKENAIAVLTETIDQTLGQMGAPGSTQGGTQGGEGSGQEGTGTGTGPVYSHQEATLIREVISLKKQVRKLEDELLRCQEEGQTMASKANQRIKTLTSNWKTAESELNRLDEFVERIREALKPHKEILVSLTSRQLLVDLGLLAK